MSSDVICAVVAQLAILLLHTLPRHLPRGLFLAPARGRLKLVARAGSLRTSSPFRLIARTGDVDLMNSHLPKQTPVHVAAAGWYREQQ